MRVKMLRMTNEEGALRISPRRTMDFAAVDAT
jgi:hypothetical protein